MLDFIKEINWNNLGTVYGRVLEIPDQIVRLKSFGVSEEYYSPKNLKKIEKKLKE
ncbi:MAG: hypothetical protein ACOC44_08875 [Promethearchaeia archaeon]